MRPVKGIERVGGIHIEPLAPRLSGGENRYEIEKIRTQMLHAEPIPPLLVRDEREQGQQRTRHDRGPPAQT